MVFCTTIRHAESVQHLIERLSGQEVAMVEGNTAPLERASILDRFKRGAVRWLVNVDVLTTGFDAPNVDAIAVMRATASPGLFAQIVGRGLRVCPGKQDCLVLDFGENIKRHGSIDSTEYGKPREQPGSRNKRSKDPTESEKFCPSCDTAIPKKDRVCECGFLFPDRKPNHDRQADTLTKILAGEEKPPERFEVINGVCTRHEKDGKTPSMRVTYNVEGHNMPYGLSEWICIEHTGWARSQAEKWWRQHCSLPCPESIDEAIDLALRGWVAVPRSVTAKRDGKFWKILEREIEEIPIGLAEGEQVEELPF
jgi:DNA repair protein RadD